MKTKICSYCDRADPGKELQGDPAANVPRGTSYTTANTTQIGLRKEISVISGTCPLTRQHVMMMMINISSSTGAAATLLNL